MAALKGKVALVTGGGSGLGRAIVERYVAEGAKVGVLERNEDTAASLADSLGDDVAVTIGDVRSLSDNKAAVAATIDAFGQLDVAVGNAGIWDFNIPAAMLPEDDAFDATFSEVFDVNVKGYLALAKASLDPLQATTGLLIYTLSNAAFYPGGGGPMYVAAKHAGVGLVKQLAYELAPVRVNGVAPGAMATDLRGPEAMGMQGLSISTIPMEKVMEKMLPIQSVITVDNYVPFYVLLASDEGSKATGNVYQCDGGLGVIRMEMPDLS